MTLIFIPESSKCFKISFYMMQDMKKSSAVRINIGNMQAAGLKTLINCLSGEAGTWSICQPY